MAAIYLARDERLDVEVAVKEMLPPPGGDPGELAESSARFEREARILARLQHPRLPRVTDHFAENGLWYLVMDYVDGDDLEQQLQQGTASVQEACEVADAVLEVLEHLHGQAPPVIYRDLKPANIMRRRCDRSIVLVDFGIATVLAPGKFTNTAIGTPGYAPREQFLGKAEVRSDLFSLGATLHQMLSGLEPLVPFQFDPLDRLRPDVPPALAQAVARALESDPTRRFQTASEMRRALAGFMGTAPAASRGSAPAAPAASPALTSAPPAPVRSWTLRQVHRLSGHEDDITALCFSADGSLLASADSAGTVRLWDVARRAELASGTLSHHPLDMPAQVDQLLLPSQGIVAVSSLIAGRPLHLATHCSAWMLTRSGSRSAPAALTAVELFRGTCYPGSVRSSADGMRVALGWKAVGDDRTVHIQVREAPSNAVVFEDHGRGKLPPQVALSRDGSAFAWSTGKSLYLSVAGSILRVDDFDHDILSLDLSADGGTVVTLADDGIALWDASSGLARARLAPPWDHPLGTLDERTVRFAPDGRTVVVGGQFELPPGASTWIERPQGRRRGDSEAYSADGRLRALARLDDTVTLYEDGREAAQWQGHRSGTLRLNGMAAGFAADGTLQVAAASDEVLRLWDVG